jgi:hypothetical protein
MKKTILTALISAASILLAAADGNGNKQKKISEKTAVKSAVKKGAEIPAPENLPERKSSGNMNSSGDIPETPPLERDKWSFFQIGFFPLTPSYTKISNVYGIKLGAPMCSGYGRVYGIEPSLLFSGTRYVNGIQATFWGACLAREVYGIQAASLGPSITGTVYGLQADGTLGMAEEVIGAQIAPVTMCSGDLTGIQFGAVNLIKNRMTGFQGGAVNIAAENVGLQFGVVNYSDIDGVQIGGINIIRNGWLPFMIGINFNF